MEYKSTNESVTDAVTSNSKIANEIITSLRDNGVKENEISTSQYSIQPNFNFTETGNMVKTGFTVSNIVTVQSPNFDNISSWIDSAVTAGANTINGVDFKVSDKSLDKVKNTLIQQAISNAKQNADIASSAIGSTIVGIKSISVNTDGFNPMPLSDQFMQRIICFWSFLNSYNSRTTRGFCQCADNLSAQLDVKNTLFFFVHKDKGLANFCG